jgi:hypothetical protein
MRFRTRNLIGLVVALGVASATVLHATQIQVRPVVTPFVNTGGAGGPAFIVECRNDSGHELSSRDAGWLEGLRLDGTVLTDEGVRIGSGGSTPIASGEVWRGMVVLLQTSTGNTPSQRAGEVVRLSRIVPLTNGRHSLAVRCRGNWSEDAFFYWVSDRQPESGDGT